MHTLQHNFTVPTLDQPPHAGLSSRVTQSPLPPVALASKSPRRRELLQAHGLRFRVVDADLDDADLDPADASPRAWVMGLAYLKAAAALQAARSALNPGWVVLGADTICESQGAIIGQPGDADEARAIIRAFRGRTHAVYTGVSLIDVDTRRRDIFIDTARVTLGQVTDHQIDDYLATGLWRGKAGAYNLLERQAAGWPITYSGDADTIVGLPIRLLPAKLARLARN